MTHSVFICYSAKDKPVADAACAALEASRIPCWIAPRDVLGGAEWGAEIVDAITACRVVVLIFSGNADSSAPVRREVELALNANKIIVPFRIENVLPSGALKYALLNRHWLDALTPRLEESLVQLAETVRRIEKEQPDPTPASATDAPKRRRIPLWGWTLAAAMALALTAVGIYLFLHRDVSLETLRGHQETVNSVVFSPDGKTLVSASSDQTVRLWNTASGNVARTLQGQSGTITSVAVSRDGRLAATGSWDQSTHIWDLATGTTLSVIPNDSWVNSVAFSPDGHTLASANQNGAIELTDLLTGKTLRTLLGHYGAVRSVVFSPDGQTLASAGEDHTACLWDWRSGTGRVLMGHTDVVDSVTFSPNGLTLASGSWDHTVRLWDVATATAKKRLSASASYVESVAFSPDGKKLAFGDWKQITLLNVADGTRLRTLWVGSSVTSLAFSPDSRILASADDDSEHTIKLWAVPGS